MAVLAAAVAPVAAWEAAPVTPAPAAWAALVMPGLAAVTAAFTSPAALV
jgi:hypothetical protein